MKHAIVALMLLASPAVAEDAITCKSPTITCTMDPTPASSSDLTTIPFGETGSITLGTDTTTTTGSYLPYATDMVKAAAILRYQTRHEEGGIKDAIDRAAKVLERCADGKTTSCEALK